MNYSLIEYKTDKECSAIERVLTNRGIPLKEVEHYLNTDDNDILPFNSIDNLREGATMLINHINKRDKVLVQVDSDADGYTSAALLLNYLYCLFPEFVENNISYRVHTGKQHGIILDSVGEDIKLVIAPDSSSNEYKIHSSLREKGIDVLVIDHHEAPRVSKDACVINNQLCNYPTKSLSGVGMVYKFCCYIDSLLQVDYASKFLDLVAIGMVADMMDLRDFETRHLVTLGIKKVENPYLKGVIKVQEFPITKHGGLDPFAIGFYIAPLINATTRMGTQEEKLILFESMLDYRGYGLIPSTKRGCKGQAETRVEQACRNCTNIKNRQTKARDESLNGIKGLIEEQNLLEHRILIIATEPGMVDKEIAGLIANQLMSEYQRPVLVLNKTEHVKTIGENNSTITEVWWEGSGRGYDKSSFKDFRGFLEASGLVEYAEGHASAFGVAVKEDRLASLIEFCDDNLYDFDFTPEYKVDFIWNSLKLQGQDILQIANFKHLWGQKVEEPYVVIENVSVTKDNLALLSPDKSPTLKITLPGGEISAIKFRSSNEEYESLYSELGCVKINIVGKCERNIWNGISYPQIIVEQYEIVERTAYYF